MGSKAGTRETGTRGRVVAVVRKAPCDDKGKGQGGNRGGQASPGKGKGKGGVECLLRGLLRVTFLRIGARSG